MAFDPDRINVAAPLYGMDNVIKVFTGTMSLAAPSASPGFTTATDTIVTGISESTYFSGIYTVDGGTTWNDFGAMIPVISGGFPVFQTVGAEGVSLPNTFKVEGTNWYNYTAGSGTPRTLSYKVLLIAKNTQGLVDTFNTDDVLQYSSGFNYPKIFKQGELVYNLTSGAGKSVSVAHDLGRIPKVSAWYQEDGGRMLSLSHVELPSTGGSYQIETRIDNSNVTFHLEAFRSTKTINGNLEYRIYLDD